MTAPVQSNPWRSTDTDWGRVIQQGRPAPVQCLAFDGLDSHCDRPPGHDGKHRERRPDYIVTWRGGKP